MAPEKSARKDLPKHGTVPECGKGTLTRLVSLQRCLPLMSTVLLAGIDCQLLEVNRLSRRCRWEYRAHFYSHSIGQEIISTIEELPALHNIEVVLHVTNSMVPVCSFRNLTSLNIIYDAHTYGLGRAESPVVSAIAASPQLQELIIRNFNRCDSKDIRSLLSDEGTLLPLQHLTLDGIPVSMPFTVNFCRILSNLRQLTLYQERHEPKPTLPDVPIAWEDIWKALYDMGSNEGVRLERLHTSGKQGPVGMKALLNYLLFHPGLKGLQLRCVEFDKDGEVNLNPARIRNYETATQFWHEVLPHHAHSLQELRVTTTWSGPWCYGPEASTALRQCTQLQEVEIPVFNGDREWAMEKALGLDSDPTFVPPPPALDPWEQFLQLVGTLPWGKIHTMPVCSVPNICFPSATH